MRANGDRNGHSIVIQDWAAIPRDVRDTPDVALPVREIEPRRGVRGERKPAKGTRHPRQLASPEIQAPAAQQERLHCLLQTVQ